MPSLPDYSTDSLEEAHNRLPLPRLRTAAEVARDLCRDDQPWRSFRGAWSRAQERRIHAELLRRDVARSAEATRHALAALGAISYAREPGNVS